MTEKDWAKLHWFNKKENWGDPDKMSPVLLNEMDAFRFHTGKKIYVSYGTQGVHEKNSTHYYGLAADIIFPEVAPKDLPDMFIAASRFNFTGIGLYPHWKLNGTILGGLHLDHRRGRQKQYWIGLPDGTYVNLNFENIKKYFI